jgi:hypothetical protein
VSEEQGITNVYVIFFIATLSRRERDKKKRLQNVFLFFDLSLLTFVYTHMCMQSLLPSILWFKLRFFSYIEIPPFFDIEMRGEADVGMIERH